MRIFSYLYNKMIGWSGHRHASYYLAGVSFIESSFFPIPPDVMLVSMGLAAPKRSWNYALIASCFSVLGGIFGYCIGYFGFELVEPYLLKSSYAPLYHQIAGWFDYYGIWIIILAGFTPIPYKLFTITAGVMQMSLFPFVIGSFIGRAGRFFLVSGILYFMGERLHNHLKRFIDMIGWSLLALVILLFCLFKWVF